MKKKTVLSLTGWAGVLMVLSAYLMVNAGIIDVKNLWYPVLNLVGSLAVMACSWSRRDFQPVVLNAVWAVTAVASLAAMAV
ncbi:MAG: hypothetical protein PHG63_03955 [Candidatus Dojkabacteria bacterium]|nr:hypothetical protein [Candidatus Dojkabacteria bacterium]